MDKELFEQLMESMRQMGEIVRGERALSREFHVDSGVRELVLSKIGETALEWYNLVVLFDILKIMNKL